MEVLLENILQGRDNDRKMPEPKSGEGSKRSPFLSSFHSNAQLLATSNIEFIDKSSSFYRSMNPSAR